MNKQPERTAKTKQALIDAFWVLYKEKSIEKITIKEITAGAGFYRSTFYEYFGSVYDVLAEVESELMCEIEKVFPSIFTAQNMQQVFHNVVIFYESNGSRLAVLLGPTGDQNFISEVKALMKKIITDHFNVDPTDIHLDLSIDMVSSSIISMLQYWYTHRDSLPLEDALKTGSNILQNGIMPQFKLMGISLPWFA